MTDDLDAIRARHVPQDLWEGDVPQCQDCGQPWPCDASRLADMLTPERVAAALQSPEVLDIAIHHEPERAAAAIIERLGGEG